MKIFKILLLLFVTVFITSCYLDKGDFNKPTSIVITADRTEIVTGQTVNFTVKTNLGDDVTADSQIFINDQPESAVFSSSTPETYTVEANLNGLISNTLTIVFKDEVKSFVKRVLIEDYTGAWCGNCPRVSYGIELVNAQTDKAVAVAIHNGSSAISFDPYHINVSALDTFIGLTGYPTAKLNRTIDWETPDGNGATVGTSQAVNLTQGDVVKLGLAMNSSLIGSTINVDVNAKFYQDYSNLKLVVCLLENELHFKQTNYTNYYNGPNIIQDFEHNHVLRGFYTDMLGDAIPSNLTVENATYTRSFSVAVPSNVANSAKLDLVAFIVNQNGTAINVRKIKVGESQTFEEN